MSINLKSKFRFFQYFELETVLFDMVGYFKDDKVIMLVQNFKSCLPTGLVFQFLHLLQINS
jgi:hypothetical protein